MCLITQRIVWDFRNCCVFTAPLGYRQPCFLPFGIWITILLEFLWLLNYLRPRFTRNVNVEKWQIMIKLNSHVRLQKSASIDLIAPQRLNYYLDVLWLPVTMQWAKVKTLARWYCVVNNCTFAARRHRQECSNGRIQAFQCMMTPLSVRERGGRMMGKLV